MLGAGQWQNLGSVRPRTDLVLVLSGLATDASGLSSFRALQRGDAARVAPIDKLGVVPVVVFGSALLGEHLAWPIGSASR